MRHRGRCIHSVASGSPDDVASAIVWLLEASQGWVTGQVIGVDGGISTVRSPRMSTPDAIVVGAGVSGLACARRLREAGLDTVVLEASDGIGGRVRTDEVDGFRLDRVFQVLPTAYHEARAVLDYERLRLRSFERGAVVRRGGRFHHVADPRRAPLIALRALGSRLVTPRDALRVARLLRGSGEETTTRPGAAASRAAR